MSEKGLRQLLHDVGISLCDYCGKYMQAQLGVCDGCKWAFEKEWEKI